MLWFDKDQGAQFDDCCIELFITFLFKKHCSIHTLSNEIATLIYFHQTLLPDCIDNVVKLWQPLGWVKIAGAVANF